MARPDVTEITFEIDGREVRAPEGEMLVDAAKRGDVEIPYFCYEPKLGQPVGACRMCLVEIEGIPKLQTACSTPVKDGMVVITTSDNVKQAQNAVVEFLLINHPLDCPVCDKGGECPLQDISYGWGSGRSRFVEPKRHFKKPLELSPLIAIDRERCILCYRCVRFSQEVAEDYQLVFLERGGHSFVGTHDGRPYVAPFSGNIIELCPVGALTSRAYRFRARPWDIEQSGSVCALCPSQCNVSFTVRDDKKVVRVLARDNKEVDDGWLCDKGRFAYQSIHSEERITHPLVRDGGYLREVSWERALGDATKALERSGERTAALLAGATTNEEALLTQRLVRQGLGSHGIDSRDAGRLDGDQARVFAQPDLTAAVPDIDHAGAILVIESELVDESPILDLRVRKAVRRNRAKLIVLTSRPSALDPNASAALRFAPGAAEGAIASLAAQLGSPRAGALDANSVADRAGVSWGKVPGGYPGAGPDSSPREVPDRAEALREVAETLAGAGDVVVIWGERVAAGPRGGQALDALLALAGALDLAGKAESGLMEIPAGTNGRGLRELGCVAGLEPGLVDAGELGRTGEEITHADDLGDLLLVHAEADEPVLEGADSVIAFANFRSDALEAHADVVFPAESHAEKEGTLTHPDGRVQRLRQAIGRPGEVRPEWQVLAELCERAGAGIDAQAVPELTAEVAKAVPFYEGLTADQIGGRGVRWQERDAASKLPAAELPDGPLEDPPALPEGLRVGSSPSLFTGPEVEHAPALRALAHGRIAELSPADAERFGVGPGEAVVVSANGDSVEATAKIRSAVPPGSIFVLGANLPQGKPVEVRPA